MSTSASGPSLAPEKLFNNMENEEGTRAAERTSTAEPSPAESCLVQTTVGEVEGFVDTSFPHVKQWLGVPFAEPPIGQRRFAPPVPKTALPAGQVLSATRMPPAPMQSYTSLPNIYAKYTPEYLASGPYSEDCLYLNVFAPAGKTTEPLPTLVFFYGGQGEWGGINSEYMQPQSWIERSQDHIVVLFNWRVGVFGFPNAKGLRNGPLGLLDQRLALEFIRDNISGFGGSPSSVVAFGQAAGSACIDAHLFAWPDDPIVSAAVCFAGAMLGVVSQDKDKESFKRLARRLGCPEDATPEEQIAFVREVDAGAIIGCFRAYNDSEAEPKMYFRPQIDNVVILTPEEQLERAGQGKFAKVPVLLGMTAEEGNGLVPYRELAAGEDSAVTAAVNWTSRFQGVLDKVSDYRLANKCTTYRCVYAGDFPNISPKPWMKAYHFSELPMIMGTHEIERGQSTDFQRQLSETMQDMWVAFARDPEKGLSAWGWQAASCECSSPMVLGKNKTLFHQENNPSQREIPLVGGKR
ncbi:hypothetical protein FQN54_006767 [Arachnomyces sp. PD_36]|nr:hypothetical protein FQN54_006767 [Arachnomyces sp. PD_36]